MSRLRVMGLVSHAVGAATDLSMRREAADSSQMLREPESSQKSQKQPINFYKCSPMASWTSVHFPPLALDCKRRPDPTFPLNP